MGIFGNKKPDSETVTNRADAEEQLIEIAQRTVAPSEDLSCFFVCSGNPSLIEAFHGIYRVGAPVYGGSAAHYRADESDLSSRQAEATGASLLFAGQRFMGDKAEAVPNVADVLAAVRTESSRGGAFVSFVSVGPTGQDWVREVSATPLNEAVSHGIFPFFMYATTSKDAAEFLIDSFSVVFAS
jgi:hypothetical protein